MWGRRRSRFCWEAFIAHEKASCLLKSYLQSSARLEGRRGSLGPHRAGDCRVGRARRTRTVYWLSQGPQSPGGKGFFCISRRFHPWSPQTASPGRCLCERLSLCPFVVSFPVPCPAIPPAAYGGSRESPVPSQCPFEVTVPEPHSFHPWEIVTNLSSFPISCGAGDRPEGHCWP